MDFKDKVVLITGSCSGIGRETAKYMARRGAQLSLAGNTDSDLRDVSNECLKYRCVEPLITVGDINDDQYVTSLVEGTVDKFGKIDVLVNAEGAVQFGNIESPQIMEQYEHSFDFNVRPIIYLITCAIPHLKKTRGNIVFVSNLAGIRSMPDLLAYSMTQKTLNQLTRCTALELAPKQIRVNAVNPRATDSPIYEDADCEVEDYYDKLKNFYPLGRLGLPSEVASVIGFLACDRAAFITGATISVDGGRHRSIG
ncbi:uncharacterized oxidoreductase TM_0325 [Halyomorpha halys]|uniref:uncharacterized oxidoreductase TM_0325 n=1 Tax=Halyomorpha halys TaxID=286706 RepID=UPI0006D50A71|nr:uncharacterized protein LOC106682110 [Halyomorpha halys]